MAEFQKRSEDKNDNGEVQLSSLPDIEINPTEVDRVCPACEKGILKYDYFLNLYCDQCGYIEASCFT